MAMTPEQFNQLATKDDLKDFVTKDHLDKRVDEVLNAVDGLANRFDKIETEFKMDKFAHDRIQNDVDQIKSHLDLKSAP